MPQVTQKSGLEKFFDAITTPEAIFFFVIAGTALLLIPTIGAFIASVVLGIKHWVLVGGGLGIAAWVFLVAKTSRFFMVSVPEVTGLITVDLPSGNMKTYASGIHFRYPWEQVKEGEYINLRADKTDEKTETFPSIDAELIAKWSIQYRSSVEKLRRYVSVDDATIHTGLNEVASSFFAMQVREKTAEEIRSDKKGVQDALKEGLLVKFRKEKVIDNPENPGELISLEDFYGITITLIAISDLDFEKSYQQARTAGVVAQKVKQTARDIIQKGKLPDGSVSPFDGTISDKDAMDYAMMVHQQGVKKEISQQTHYLDASPAVIDVIRGVVQKALNATR